MNFPALLTFIHYHIDGIQGAGPTIKVLSTSTARPSNFFEPTTFRARWRGKVLFPGEKADCFDYLLTIYFMYLSGSIVAINLQVRPRLEAIPSL